MVDKEYYRLFYVRFVTGFNKIFESYGPGKIFTIGEAQKKLHWELGIDQSTKQTGLFLRTVPSTIDEKGTGSSVYSVMIDLRNKGLPSNALYSLLLKEFISNNFGELKFDRVYMEKPIEQAEYRYSANTLEMLHGVMDLLQYELDCFKGAEIQFIPPVIWRKSFLADPRYKGRRQAREEVKFATAEEVCCRHAKFKYYLNWSLGQSNYVPDSFDAVGILEGGLGETFYKGNRAVRRINGMLTARGGINYTTGWVSIPKDLADLEDFVSDYVEEDILEDRGLTLLVCDTKFKSLDDLCRGVAWNTSSVAVVLFVDKKYDSIIKWETSVEKDPQEVYAAIVYRDNPSKKVTSLDRFGGYVEICDLFEDELDSDEDFEDLVD